MKFDKYDNTSDFSIPSSIMLKPFSSGCNLSCSYCYYPGHQVKYFNYGKMKYETLEKIISQYNSINAKSTNYTWQGGEPLLCGIDFFKSVVKLQSEYGYPEQLIGNALQTNGTLLSDEWASFFKEYEFLIGISLDGPSEIHDNYRRYKDKRPTFKEVMKGINILQKYKVNFNILTVVNKINVSKAKEIYNFFKDNGFYYLQFIPCIEPDKKELDKISPESITPDEYLKFLLELFECWKDDWNLIYIRLFDSMVKVFIGKPPDYCILSHQCNNAVFVESNGDFFTCDFFPLDKWFLGNIHNKPITEILTNPKLKIFSNIKKQKVKDNCLECEYIFACNGGCLREHSDRLGVITKRYYFCKSYKEFYKITGDTLKEIGIKAMKRKKEQ